MNIVIEEIVINPILQIDNVINEVNIEVSDVAIPGQKGDKGDVGLQGIQGEIGLTGSQGIQGEIGLTGLQGIQGIQGIKGDVGLQGIQGEIGLTGRQGIQGLKGEQGIQGAPGSGVKITPWTAKSYASGDQVNHLGKDWVSNAATVAGDVPGTSPKWVERLSGYGNEIKSNTTKSNLTRGDGLFNYAGYVRATEGIFVPQVSNNVASDFIELTPTDNFTATNLQSSTTLFRQATFLLQKKFLLVLILPII